MSLLSAIARNLLRGRPVGLRPAVHSLPVLLCVLIAMLACSQVALAQPTAGSVLGFGLDEEGQLADGSASTTPAGPVEALGLPAGDPVTQLASGESYSLFVTRSGALYSVGYNYSGQLGIATNFGTNTPDLTPTLVALPGEIGHVTQAAAGDLSSVVVTSSGQLYAFGDNQFGQLGVSATVGSSSAVPTLVPLPAGAGAVTQVAAGLDETLVLTSNGRVYAFGDNRYGQLGNNTNTNTTGTPTVNVTPALVSIPGEVGVPTEVAAGAGISAVVTSSGQLFMFGANDGGALGNSLNQGTLNPDPTPTQVAIPGSVVRVALGSGHVMAETSSGALYTFGWNGRGQLGDENALYQSTGSPTPTELTLPAGAGAIVQFAGSYEDSYVLTSSGQLYVFGSNRYGQLGSSLNLGTSYANPTPEPISLPGAATLDAIGTGPMAEHLLGLVADLAISTTSLPTGDPGSPYSATPTASGGTGPYSWSAGGLPAGLQIDPATGTLAGTPTADGSYQVALTVTDSHGIQSSAMLALTIGASAAGTTSGPLAPVLSGLSQAHAVWSERRSAHRRAAAVGTSFSFTLNEAAMVRLSFTRRVAGRRAGAHRCVVGSPRNRSHARCTRLVAAGSFLRAAKAGHNRLAFRGSVRGRVLVPGRYIVSFTALTSGQRSGGSTLSFTIKR